MKRSKVVVDMLIVIPNGGLGNRLMAMMSAKVLAEHIGCELQVSWQPEGHLPYTNCQLSGLFEGLESIPSSEKPSSGKGYYEHHTPGARPEIEERLKAGETIHLRSYCFIKPQDVDEGEFARLLHRQFDMLKPQPELLARVFDLPPGTIGIQIRSGENWRSTRYSPLALFFRIMDGHCERDSEIQFYLTSDSPRVHRLLRKRYGGRILSHEQQPIWAEEGASTRRALVKILTMAKTACIYHSFSSSFGYIAHLFSRQPFFCVGLRNRPQGWYGSPFDRMHDRLTEWNHDTRLWRKRDLPEASPLDRLQAEWIFCYTRFIYSKGYQLWPWHRMGPLE